MPLSHQHESQTPMASLLAAVSTSSQQGVTSPASFTAYSVEGRLLEEIEHLLAPFHNLEACSLQSVADSFIIGCSPLSGLTACQ
jgi:hypothetical protein